jgi:hypothetical protein
MRPFDRNATGKNMNTSLRRYAASFLACLGLALPAAATTFSTDYTDLWLVPTEPGWGLNVVNQGDTIFASLYVYGGDTLPRWYFASDLRGSGGNNFTGTLYRSQGSSFASPWNPAQFTGGIPVGSMTLNFSTATTATLSYTVDGIAVTKNISRFAFKLNNLSGNYVGGMTAISNSCGNPANSNQAILIAGFLTVTHGSGNPRFVVDFSNAQTGQAATCTFTGAYIQEGKLGSIPNGTWSCTGGANNTGTFNMQQIDAKLAGFNAVVTGQDQYCRYVGYFGGVTDVQ